MLNGSSPEDVRKSYLKVMELLDLGRLGKGSLLTDIKHGWVQRSEKSNEASR